MNCPSGNRCFIENIPPWVLWYPYDDTLEWQRSGQLNVCKGHCTAKWTLLKPQKYFQGFVHYHIRYKFKWPGLLPFLSKLAELDTNMHHNSIYIWLLLYFPYGWNVKTKNQIRAGICCDSYYRTIILGIWCLQTAPMVLYHYFITPLTISFRCGSAESHKTGPAGSLADLLTNKHMFHLHTWNYKICATEVYKYVWY